MTATDVIVPPITIGAADAHLQRPRRLHIPRSLRRTLSPIALVVVWQLACSYGLVDDRTLASPARVVGAGRQLWATGELQRNLLASLDRVLLGLLFGVGAG